MQFTLITILSLVAVTFSSPISLTGRTPISLPERLDDIVARSPQTVPAVNTENAAMSDASGNVVAFNSTGVYIAAAAAASAA